MPVRFPGFFCSPDSDLRDEIQEAGQRLVSVIPHVAELHNHLLLQFVINDRDGERRGLICQEVPIVCTLEMKLQI